LGRPSSKNPPTTPEKKVIGEDGLRRPIPKFSALKREHRQPRIPVLPELGVKKKRWVGGKKESKATWGKKKRFMHLLGFR